MATSLDGFEMRTQPRRPLRSTRPDYGYREYARVPQARPTPVFRAGAPQLETHERQVRPVFKAPIQTEVAALTQQASAERQQDSSYEHRRPSRDTSSKVSRGFQRAHALYGLAGIIVMFGVTVSVVTLRTNHSAQAQIAQNNNSLAQNDAGDDASGSNPSTDKPSPTAVGSYAVAPDLPKYIRIPSLDVFARVRQLGLTKEGALAAPTNVYDAGWYMGSAKPGDPGATLIDGHVSSWSTKGVFHNLNRIKVNDLIEVEVGDGTKRSYKVVQTQQYKADALDMPKLMVSAEKGKSGLNIITCAGKVVRGTNDFEDRFAVFAVEQ